MTSTSIHISSDSEAFEGSENCPWWEEEEEIEERSSKFVYNQRGERQALGPMLAQGGEGKIFPLLDNPGTLVKLFHDKILCDQTRKIRLRDKLRAMSKLREFGRDTRFAWPRLPVFDENDQWIGYGMRRCEGRILHLLCSPGSAIETFPNWTRIELLKVCLNLIEGLNALHHKGVMIGDLSTANFLITDDASVRFIDCDAYHLQSRDGRTYPCEVRTDLFTAPELLEQSPDQVVRKPCHELFSDAVLFYEILMLGAHPYSHRFGQDPVSNLRSGNCPLGRGASCRLPMGPWRNLWSHLTYNLKSLFLKAFREGHSDPSARPALREWKKAMLQCMRVMSNPETENSSELLPCSSKTQNYVGDNEFIITSVKNEKDEKNFRKFFK